MPIMHNCKLMRHSIGTIVTAKNQAGELDFYKITKVDRENASYEIENVKGETWFSNDNLVERAPDYFQLFGLK